MVGDRSTKLLVLDDEEELCELLVDLLNASNFQAVGVCSLDEATKILSDQDFDFFISDFYLGDKTPVDLIQRIRAGELGKNKNCNIFVCTGEPDVRELKDLKDSISAVFPKPYNYDEIVEKVRGLC